MIRRVIKEITSFLRLLRGMPPTRTRASTSGQKQLRDAFGLSPQNIPSTKGAEGRLLAKVLRDGQQEKVYGDPSSKNRVVEYGGRTHRKKKSTFVTVLLILLLALVVLSVLV